MVPRARSRLSTLLLAVFLVTLPLGWSLGGNAAVKVINDTDYYLHVFIDGDPYLYVPPQHGVGKDYESYSVVANVRVLIAPGQAASGSVTQQLNVAAVTTTDWTCADSWCGERTETIPGQATWDVVPSDFETPTKGD